MSNAIAGSARQAVAACMVGAAALLLALPGSARQPAAGAGGGQAAISVAQLPASGRATYALIRDGGPFPYDKDGSVFGNYERQLPARKRGYYREYTVRTPGVRDRGGRRIVCGGAPRTPDACYYSGDHYASFREIRP